MFHNLEVTVLLNRLKLSCGPTFYGKPVRFRVHLAPKNITNGGCGEIPNVRTDHDTDANEEHVIVGDVGIPEYAVKMKS